jgi:hypothetical protein
MSDIELANKWRGLRISSSVGRQMMHHLPDTRLCCLTEGCPNHHSPPPPSLIALNLLFLSSEQLCSGLYLYRSPLVSRKGLVGGVTVGRHHQSGLIEVSFTYLCKNTLQLTCSLRHCALSASWIFRLEQWMRCGRVTTEWGPLRCRVGNQSAQAFASVDSETWQDTSEYLDINWNSNRIPRSGNECFTVVPVSVSAFCRLWL